MTTCARDFIRLVKPEIDARRALIDTLKHCPFCGSNELIVDCSDDSGKCYILCSSCWTSSANKDSLEEVIAAWNTRADAPKLTTQEEK